MWKWCLAVSIAALLLGCESVTQPSGRPGGRDARGRLRRLDHVQKWLCYYGSDRGVLKVPGMQMLVLDADNIGRLTEEDKAGRVCLAYLSLGEAEEFRWYWNEVRGAAWILGENPNWGRDHLVDTRSHAWRHLVVKQVARRLIDRGYDGFMLDTLDTVESLMQTDAKRFAGVATGMARIVSALRAEYPDAVLLANRGFSMLPQTAPYIDGLLVEGVRSTYDFAAKKSRDLKPDEIAWMDAQLGKARGLGLPIFALDYVEPPDPEHAAEVEERLRQAGCRPLVSVIKLNAFPGQVESP